MGWKDRFVPTWNEDLDPQSKADDFDRADDVYTENAKVKNEEKYAIKESKEKGRHRK